MEQSEMTKPESETTEVDSTQLKTIVERIERMEEEKAAVMDDIKEIYAEAKGNGFDAKIIRKVIRLRRMDRQEREAEEEILNLYMENIGD